MIPVRLTSSGTFAATVGNPEVASLDGSKRAPLFVILHESWTAQERAEFGIYLATPFITPQGKIRVGTARYERSSPAANVAEVYDVEDPPPPTAEELRQAEFAALPDRADLKDRLSAATPAQIDNWIDTNVTSVATARALFKAIVKLLVSVRFRGNGG